MCQPTGIQFSTHELLHSEDEKCSLEGYGWLVLADDEDVKAQTVGLRCLLPHRRTEEEGLSVQQVLRILPRCELDHAKSLPPPPRRAEPVPSGSRDDDTVIGTL